MPPTDSNVLTLTRITKDVGATIKPGPMVVAGPNQVRTDADLADVAAGSGLNGPLLADLVVAMAAHENMGVNLYRVLQNLTVNPMLKSAFATFERDSIEAVAVHAELMAALGIPMYYVSPAARMTEGLDSHMIMSFLESGSADPLTLDMKAVEAVFLAASMCVANTDLLRRIATEADDGAAKEAMEAAIGRLVGPQTTHLEWAAETRQKMALMLLQHPIAQKATQWAETAIAKLTGKVG